jgi:hypothetical protein
LEGAEGFNDLKVVVNEKIGGVGKVSNVRIWIWTVAIEVYFLFEHAVFELKVLFPFPPVTAT